MLPAEAEGLDAKKMLQACLASRVARVACPDLTDGAVETCRSCTSC